MNNLSSYCGLDDAKIRASHKDLPVVAETPICVPNKSKNEAFMEADTVASIDIDSAIEFE